MRVAFTVAVVVVGVLALAIALVSRTPWVRRAAWGTVAVAALGLGVAWALVDLFGLELTPRVR